MHTRTHTRTRALTYTRTYIHTHTHARWHAHTHYTNTHAQTHTPEWPASQSAGNCLVVICPAGNYLVVVFPAGNCLVVVCPAANCLVVICPAGNCGGDLSSGELSGGDLSSGELSGGGLSSGELSGGGLSSGELSSGELFGARLCLTPVNVSQCDRLSGRPSHILHDSTARHAPFCCGDRGNLARWRRHWGRSWSEETHGGAAKGSPIHLCSLGGQRQWTAVLSSLRRGQSSSSMLTGWTASWTSVLSLIPRREGQSRSISFHWLGSSSEQPFDSTLPGAVPFISAHWIDSVGKQPFEFNSTLRRAVLFISAHYVGSSSEQPFEFNSTPRRAVPFTCAHWVDSVNKQPFEFETTPRRAVPFISACWVGSVSDTSEQPFAFNSTPTSREHASPWIRQREWAGCCWRCQSEECQSASVWMNQTGSAPSLDLQCKASKWYTVLPAILVPEVGPAPYVTWICGVEKNKIRMFYTCMLGQIGPELGHPASGQLWKWWRLFRRKADNLFAVKTKISWFAIDVWMRVVFWLLFSWPW